MSLVVLESNCTLKEKKLIEICKSNSEVSGYKLREAHYALGESTAIAVIKRMDNNKKGLSVLVMMRAGLNYALGVSDMLEKLGNSVDIHFINNDLVTLEILEAIKGKQVLVVDAVINSGKSIFDVFKQLPENAKKNCLVLTTVMPSNSTVLLTDLNVITVRVSEHQYKGAKVTDIQGSIGPDTGDRLFGTLKF